MFLSFIANRHDSGLPFYDKGHPCGMTFITPTLLDLSVLAQSKRIKGIFILYFGNLSAGYSVILASKKV
jgi:hypothetical protein